jgi:hypothetical protein
MAVSLLCGRGTHAAPGDLDPTFANVGRFSNEGLQGSAWSVLAQEDGTITVGGGQAYRDGSMTRPVYQGFFARLLPNGTLDAKSSSTHIVYDSVAQPDGKTVRVGIATPGTGHISRATPGGVPDPGFGDGGSTIYSPGTPTSVLLEFDGRIVVAGTGSEGPAVLRLLASGEPDLTFGTSGRFIGTGGRPPSPKTEILRSADGGYRLLVHDEHASQVRCRVLALTENRSRR